jgi:hypothetical protein
VTLTVPADAPTQKAGKPYDQGDLKDDKEYHVVHVLEDEVRIPGTDRFLAEGRYLVDDIGHLAYKTDLPIQRESKKMDTGDDAPANFRAPQPKLFAIIIGGILRGKLEWTFVAAGALIAIAMELMGVSALPVAVGMYLGLTNAVPIFIGGLIRWLADKVRGVSATEAESETSPGVLLSSGYIAGGTLCGLIIGFFAMLPAAFNDALNVGQHFGGWFATVGTDFANMKVSERTALYLDSDAAKLIAVAVFVVLAAILFFIGRSKSTELEAEDSGGIVG